MNAKKLSLLILLAGLAAHESPANTVNLGSPTSQTPYDRYLSPVWTVFGELNAEQPPLEVVEKLVREGRGFRYSYRKDEPYVPQAPEETEARRSGDCKAKSLWLAAKMDTRKIRFVIGKAKAGDSMSHAWLMWESPDGWLVLDATAYSRPLSPSRLSPSQLVPFYSYSPSGKFTHSVSAAGRGAKYGDHL